MRILITCFMPFKGRSKNGSQVLARYLQTHNHIGQLRVTDMAVRWGAVESVTDTIIKQWEPEVILGLGEGDESAIAFETVGRNIRDGEDVDGVAPKTNTILKNGEPQRRCRLKLSWTQQMRLPLPLKISLDAGTYLCNNALYMFAGTECDRVGFIHVPPQNELEDIPYSELYGPIILEILRQNVSV